MKPWDSLRQEVVGAWRSVRYDFDHRSKAGVESKSRLWPIFSLRGQTDRTRPFDPDATAVLGPVGPEQESIWAPLRHPRRLVATMVVASGVAASAMGTFFAVGGGLGVLLVDSHGAATASPTVPASAPQVGVSATPQHRQTSTAPKRPSPSASATASPSASASASAHVSPTPSRSADPAKPSPSATAVPTASASPTPDTTPSATDSNDTSPSATSSAPATP